jgi:uncharacterized membrane protein YfcA
MAAIDLSWFILCCAAFLAGLVDSIVGGGGLIQVPALFSTFPNIPAASLFGTNKLSGLWGTSTSAINYSRRISLKWEVIVPAAGVAFVMAFAGAYTVTRISSDLIRKALPFVLLFVAIYTFTKKELGSIHAPRQSGVQEKLIAMLIGICVGFYDGFFGPGTGSFLVFLFVRFLGFDFLRASASAKIVNVACNFAALIWFGCSGHVMWKVGLVLAALNVSGAVIGSHFAIRGGSQLIRKIFLFVLGILLADTSWNAIHV